MIALLHGTLAVKGESYAVVDVSGIGYKVAVPKETLARLALGDEVLFSTHLVVKEDALDLYGFETDRERDFFAVLISISGIGPKGALGILNLASIETLEQAILSGDSGYLTKVSGIGKKTGEKIVLELKDKISLVMGKDAEGTVLGGATKHQDVDAIDALIGLGYSAREARGAVSDIPNEIAETDEKIRTALKMLGRK